MVRVWRCNLIIKGLYGSILDAWELTDDSLYLLQFNAETTNLYLTVSTTYKLDVTRWQIAHDVTRTIGVDVFLLSGEGILDKHFCVFIRSVQVAERHMWSGCP